MSWMAYKLWTGCLCYVRGRGGAVGCRRFISCVSRFGNDRVTLTSRSVETSTCQSRRRRNLLQFIVILSGVLRREAVDAYLAVSRGERGEISQLGLFFEMPSCLRV